MSFNSLHFFVGRYGGAAGGADLSSLGLPAHRSRICRVGLKSVALPSRALDLDCDVSRLLQLGLAGEGGAVDPVGGDRLGDDVEGGLLPCRRDEDFVGRAASGHRDVEVAHVGRSVEEQDAGVDRSALCAGSGSGVGEVDVFGDVLPRQSDRAARSLDRDRQISMDRAHGPLGSVADHLASIGEQLPIVLPGRDLFTDEEDVPPGECCGAVGVEFACTEPLELALQVEIDDRLVGRRHE